MDTQRLVELVQANLAAGHSLDHAAKTLIQQDPHIHVAELITVLKESKGTPEMVSFSIDSEDQSVRDAIFYAKIAVAALPETTAAQLAVALKDPRNFPHLTALQMGEVLKAEGVFPQITAQQMQDALVAAQYSAADASAAVAQLFPKTVSYRRLGPVGAPGQMPFDDNAQATTQPLTQLIVRHGNIIDSIQAFYAPSTGTAVHGGNGGGPTTVPLSGDPIIEISGYTGYWFGADYVLQITIKTRSRTHGPFGNMDYASGVKTPFAMTAQANEEIVGFFGSAAYGNNGQSVFLGSLGVIIKTQ